MRAFIASKRDGGEISAQGWRQIVAAFMSGAIDDAQIAALFMACVVRGMSLDEAHALTSAMIESGDVLQFDRSAGTVVDKHSSGGVSDIVSLAAVPLAAACGARVAKLSGRALGHTGGTIDKLEAIPGFNVHLSSEQFVEVVQRVGCAIAAQSDRLVPADKRFYRLRDRTATVPAMGLIASSIVSKKVAGGAQAFVFDVKTGAASFMREVPQASELAAWLIDISTRLGKRAAAFVTDMNEPLGRCIGTGIEVIEARDFLRGDRDPRPEQVVCAIAAAMVTAAGIGEADRRVREALDQGDAYEKFTQMIAAQGGDVAAMERLQTAEGLRVDAPSSGYVGAIDVVRLGILGRQLSESDKTGGLRLAVRIGDVVEGDQPLAYVCGTAGAQVRGLENAFAIVEEAPPPRPVIYERSTSAIM